MGGRKARRTRVTCCLFFFGENDFEGEARVLDCSTTGCRAETKIHVEKGMELQLSLFLSDHQWPLRIERAVVRWVSGQLIGLEVLTMRPAQRERLRSLVMKSNVLVP